MVFHTSSPSLVAVLNEDGFFFCIFLVGRWQNQARKVSVGRYSADIPKTQDKPSRVATLNKAKRRVEHASSEIWIPDASANGGV